MTRASVVTGDAAAIGAVIRRLRIGKGWNLVQFAKRSGKTATWLGLMERGSNTPSVATLLDLAEVLNVSAADIVREAEEARRVAVKRRAAALAAREKTPLTGE